MDDEAVRFDETTLPGLLPREALSLVAELLAAADDPADAALGRRLRKRIGFVLEAEPAGGRRSLFDALPPFPRPGPRREAPGPAACAQIPPEDVAAWFGPDGPFARDLPGYEPRPEQMRMAAAVAQAFNEGRHLVVEAGTGVGKTMAYLVPAVLWSLANRAPVVVSTNTKNLQEQVFRKDLPVLAAHLSTPVRFALVKGRGNYLCLRRLERLVERREAELPPAAMPALARAVAWAFLTPTGDLSGFDPGPAGRAAGPDGTPAFPVARIASLSEECRGRACPHAARCFLRRARAESLAADLVVTNHAVFFSEPDAEPLALPKAAQVVFDEAHNLEEAATEHFVREATPWTFRRLLRRLHAPRRSRRGAAAGGTGIVAETEALLLRGGVMAREDGRAAMFDILSRAAEGVGRAARSARAWGRALGAIPRKGETARRLVPASLETPAWNATLGPMRELQDDLWGLSVLLDLAGTAFSPPAEPGPDGAAAGPPRVPRALPFPPPGSSPAAREGVELALAPLALPPAAVAGAPAAAGGGGGRLAGEVADLARRLRSAAEEIRGLLHQMDFLAAADDEDWAYWIEMGAPEGPAAAEAGLRAAPVEIAGFLADALFAKRDSVVLCSATMCVGGDASFLSRRLGLDRLEPGRVAELREGSPFDWAAQCVAAVPMFLPAQAAGPGGSGDGPFEEAFAALLARLAREAGGRTLALFTSHRQLRAVAARVREELEPEGFRVLAQGGDATREEMAGALRAGRDRCVLLGADSFWEGVDFAGDALTCVAIAKLPFASPGDPLVDARSERVARDGGSPFRDYAVPDAVLRFRQGFGRLVRSRSDRGAVVLADTRLFAKGYGAIFRRALPAEPRRFDDPDAFWDAVLPFLRPRAEKLPATSR